MTRAQLRTLAADLDSLATTARTLEFLRDYAASEIEGVRERALRVSAEDLEQMLRNGLRQFAPSCRRGALQG